MVGVVMSLGGSSYVASGVDRPDALRNDHSQGSADQEASAKDGDSLEFLLVEEDNGISLWEMIEIIIRKCSPRTVGR